MATNFLTQSSLLQPKPSLYAKTFQIHLCLASPSSLLHQGFVFCRKKKTGAVGKLSLGSAASNSKSSILEENENTKKPIVVIDNYDSFTYNLCQYMGELGCHFEVYRNDELTVEELKRRNPRGVLISPGPCIGEAFGGKIVRSPYGVMHGKSSLVYYDEKGEDGLFTGLSNPFNVGRYHSLVIEKDSFPEEALEVTAWTEDGLIMAARHKVYNHIQGVQFHPESIITSEGKTIVRNFIKLVERKESAESRN